MIFSVFHSVIYAIVFNFGFAWKTEFCQSEKFGEDAKACPGFDSNPNLDPNDLVQCYHPTWIRHDKKYRCLNRNDDLEYLQKVPIRRPMHMKNMNTFSMQMIINQTDIKCGENWQTLKKYCDTHISMCNSTIGESIGIYDRILCYHLDVSRNVIYL